MFSLYTADFSLHLRYCRSHQYADDIQIYFSFPQNSIVEASQHINTDLETISQISEAHGLILNGTKTQMLIFGRSREDILTGDDFNITLNGLRLTSSEVGKNLGIFFDKNLRFDNHVSFLLQKSYSKLKLLYRYKDTLSIDAKLKLTDSLILSHLAYGDVLYWPALTAKSKNSLQKLQNACLRYSYGLRKFDHITPAFLNSSWLNLEERFFVHLATLIFKISKYEQPKYLNDKLIRGSDVHQRVTRHRGLYSVPRHKTAIFQRSFTYNSVKTYNSLPDDIKSCTSADSVKGKLKKLIKSGRG